MSTAVLPPDSEKRVALVTGASSGIGAAIARAFGERGWSVAICARRVDRLEAVGKEIEALGGHAFARALDLGEPRTVEGFVEAAEAALGPLDVVVSNAGLCNPGLLRDVTVDQLEQELAVNLLSPLVLARRAVRSMLAREAPGDLVFISSENAVRPRPYQVGYTATKMGLEGLARALAMELEGSGIRSTIVRPGPTGTEFARDWAPGVLEDLLASWKYWGLQRHLRWMPPESVAQVVVATVTAPRGTHLDVVQVMPEGPGRPSAQQEKT